MTEAPLLEQPLVIAHRGASAYAPENTLSAFALAADQGADVIEFDVRKTADGRLAVIHDATVDRTTNGSGLVVGFTADDLSQLDAGGGQHIPTLPEVLDLAAERDLGVCIEIKAPGCVALVAEAVSDSGISEQVMVSSFAAERMEDVAVLAPDMARGHLIGGRPRRLAHVFQQLRPVRAMEQGQAQSCHLHRALARGSIVRRLHQRGIPVYVWTVDRPAMMRSLLTAGVDGIFTNRPDVLRAVIDGRSDAGSWGAPA